MTICTGPTASPIVDIPTVSDHRLGRPASAAARRSSSAAGERSIISRLRGGFSAARRLLPALSSSTPSHDAIATLSQRDRLGERH